MKQVIINKENFELFLNSNIEEKLKFEELKLLKEKINSNELIFNYVNNKYTFSNEKYKIFYYGFEETEKCYSQHDISHLFYKENLTSDFHFVIQNIETKEKSLFAGNFNKNKLNFIFFKNIKFNNHNMRFSYIQNYSGIDDFYKKRLFIAYHVDDSYYNLININISNLDAFNINKVHFELNKLTLFEIFDEQISNKYTPKVHKYHIKFIKEIKEYDDLLLKIKNNFNNFYNLVNDDKIDLIVNMIDNFEKYFE